MNKIKRNTGRKCEWLKGTNRQQGGQMSQNIKISKAEKNTRNTTSQANGGMWLNIK